MACVTDKCDGGDEGMVACLMASFDACERQRYCGCMKAKEKRATMADLELASDISDAINCNLVEAGVDVAAVVTKAVKTGSDIACRIVFVYEDELYGDGAWVVDGKTCSRCTVHPCRPLREWSRKETAIARISEFLIHQHTARLRRAESREMVAHRCKLLEQEGLRPGQPGSFRYGTRNDLVLKVVGEQFEIHSREYVFLKQAEIPARALDVEVSIVADVFKQVVGFFEEAAERSSAVFDAWKANGC